MTAVECFEQFDTIFTQHDEYVAWNAVCRIQTGNMPSVVAKESEYFELSFPDYKIGVWNVEKVAKVLGKSHWRRATQNEDTNLTLTA